ncbi:MAG: SPOR domain-containing protein [Candidatus Omnitrophica bacterium]|nr:SPOR domain-containing protein [Candidatus Omnitrophota bacterium]
MLKFIKKQTKEGSGLAQLSEEDIQKKLYGAYKPGTLGKVIKVNEETEDISGEGEELNIEPDLFSDVTSLEVDKSAQTASPIEDASEEIITEPADLIARGTKKQKVVIEKPAEIKENADDDDILQIDFNKDEDAMFLAPSERFASVKVTLEEIWDKIKGMGAKFFIISGGIFVGIILGFNLISSYVTDRNNTEVVVVNEKRPAPVIAQKNTPKKEPIREVVSQSVELPAVTVKPATSDTGSSRSVTAVAAPKYTVQICVSNKLDATESLVAELKDAGYAAFYRDHTTRTGRELYFVYVGQFATRDEATIAMNHYRTVDKLKKYNDSFVTNMK